MDQAITQVIHFATADLPVQLLMRFTVLFGAETTRRERPVMLAAYYRCRLRHSLTGCGVSLFEMM